MKQTVISFYHEINPFPVVFFLWMLTTLKCTIHEVKFRILTEKKKDSIKRYVNSKN